jgi:hypothetical protein
LEKGEGTREVGLKKWVVVEQLTLVLCLSQDVLKTSTTFLPCKDLPFHLIQYSVVNKLKGNILTPDIIYSKIGDNVKKWFSLISQCTGLTL